MNMIETIYNEPASNQERINKMFNLMLKLGWNGFQHYCETTISNGNLTQRQQALLEKDMKTLRKTVEQYPKTVHSLREEMKKNHALGGMSG